MIPIVKRCIFNHIRRYWLLFNAMNVAFSLSVAMQSEIEQFDINSNKFVRGDFDYELQAL